MFVVQQLFVLRCSHICILVGVVQQVPYLLSIRLLYLLCMGGK